MLEFSTHLLGASGTEFATLEQTEQKKGDISKIANVQIDV